MIQDLDARWSKRVEKEANKTKQNAGDGERNQKESRE
jgi:hypothetical protein